MQDVWAFEYRPGPAPVSARRRRIERAAWFGAVAGLICIVPTFLLYMARHSHLLPAAAWAQLLVEMTSYSIVAGTTQSAAIAWGMSLGSQRAGRIGGAMLLGGLNGAVVTAFGVSHFGSKPIPYFGGGTLYVTVTIGVLVFAACHVHSEAQGISWPRALRCTLTPLPFAGAFLGALGLLAPTVVQLDYAAFRMFAYAAGLSVLGAFGGLAGGALIAACTATGAELARRQQR